MNMHDNAASSYVIEPAAVAGPAGRRHATSCFPVHRIYCVGRNYAAHAVEMGHDPNKEPPFFFQKNPDNLDTDGEFPYPPASNDVHHEIEMVVALKSGGTDIPVEQGAGLRLRLWRRPRHDAPRPAGQGQGDGPALGSRQGLRGIGALLAAGAGERDRPSRPRARSGSTSTASAGRPATSTR